MRQSGSWIALALLVAFVSWGVREAFEARFFFLPADGSELGADATWFSAEPDGLYHVRRVERALSEGLPPAATDPAMNFPDGAAIPWPPYYDALLTVALRPVVGPPPDEREARLVWRQELDRAAATLPLVFGIGISLLLVAAGAAVAGRSGALAAGLMHALCFGAAQYAAPGIADHHAFVGLLLVMLLLLFGEGLRRGALERRSTAVAFGLAAGLGAGLLLGTWVASLVYLLVIQLCFGLLIVADAVRGDAETRWVGLAPFGLVFHLAALLAVLPAVRLSPWATSDPWMVVNLSWFHPTLLALGALIFLPLLRLRPGAWPRRFYPLAVALGLGVLAVVLGQLDAGPVAGIREGFEWSSRANDFMGGIAESLPLSWAEPLGRDGWFRWLGFGALLALPAWGFAVASVKRRPDLLPWVVAMPVFLLQAAAQRRFSDAAAIPLALLVAWWLVLVSRRLRPRALATAAPVVMVLLVQLPALSTAAEAWRDRQENRQNTFEVQSTNALRAAFDWIGRHSSQQAAVMALWDQGHAIELHTGMGSVATNFGSYVGEDGFRDAARFFVSGDVEAGEWILDRHDVRFVLVQPGLFDAWPQLQIISGLDTRWADSTARALFEAWNPACPDYLRLRWMYPFGVEPSSPRLLPGQPQVPAALVYERVKGAVVLVEAQPGLEVSLELPADLAGGRAQLLFARTVRAGGDGLARFRVPYEGDATVRRGQEELTLTVRPRDVRRGAELRLP